ncbi:S-layer homology domain-containing protein [Viridibacillus sp. NPDC093762]|uniref:S-layer homology domain-containing protein n=1 Tax=Viridibacillus sp. NPDC093762 TaxID=3390720 RepID=UPI003D038605
MGKFNLKFVKPVASLAIGAAVLTGSFAVSGAADTAFAKAATVKVSKGKLVSAKSGKAVKGYKSYKGVLYKNGKKFTGLYKNTYYKTGKKGTGLYKNVYYKAGKKGSGWVGSGSSKKWYQDGKLLTGLGKNSGKLFIKGKYANGIVTYKGQEKLYKDGVVVKTVVDAAKAINNTTVEVTFAEAQKASDISAGRFKIEGLEVTNASVKQTDDKVIVLTTAAQTGGKTYTVALDGVKSRTFKGVSNVLPTAITNVTPSLQGIIGKEVTVKTQVDVPAGQSKEGIAVTFNITNSADTSVGNFGKKITAEAFTDANGVASYSYTQYVAGTDDTVEAYPTGNASLKATAAKVYWGNTERLTITEVTTGNALANGSKKVYKVKAQNYATAYDANNKALYNYVNVAFAENVNVTPDKLVRGASIEDTGISGNASYPSQVTTGGVNKVQVKLDANGEATFTVTGSNAAVTPIVFVDAATKDDKLASTELQAKAATVTFALSHTLGLAVKAEGVQNAAAINVGNANNKGTGEGGRSYTVTVTDKDGKVAPAGTKAYVTFAEGSYSTDKKAYILNGTSRVEANKTVRHEISVTGTKGEATFTLVGDHDAYAAPTVYLENGKEFGLDKADLQIVGETTYFVNAVVNNALLTVVDADGKEVTTLPTTKTAYFNYDSVDQNEFEYFTGNGNYEVSYQVTAHFADVTANGKVVKKGTTETIKVNASAGKAVLAVTSENVGSNVTVNASASQASLPNKTASIAFTKGSQLPAVYTGVISSIDTSKNTLTFAGYDAIKYSTSSFKNEQGIVINEAKFEEYVTDALAAKKKVTVSAVQGTDGTYVLEIEKIENGSVVTGTITKAELNAAGDELTVTFDKDLKASSVVYADFTLTGVASGSIKSVSGNKVVLNVTGASTSSTVAVAADSVEFTDGSSNSAITAKPVTQPVVNKISTLSTTKQNIKGATEVLAKGDVTVDTKTVTATVTAGEDQAAYNGLKIKFVGSTTAATPSAAYNSSDKEVTVTLGYSDGNNTLSNVNTAIQGLAAHGTIDFAKITLTGTALESADVATAKTITLGKGVTAATATAGVYAFTISNNLSSGDVITVNGKSYVAGTDFTVGSTNVVTATNLAVAIEATDKRFATVTSAAGVITLTDATADGAAKPTLSIK